MSLEFKIEIISPDKSVFSGKTEEAILPCFEGLVTILKDHIPLITFLRPGLTKVEKKDGNFEEFFVEDGTIEFFNNTLVLLSTSVINVKDLSKEFLDDKKKEIEKGLSKEKITDEERYLLNHKMDTIKEIRI